MSPIGTIWGDLRQRQTKVILSVAALAGLELEQPHFEFGVTNKSTDFLAKFPLGKIPAFEDPEGWTLIEGATIAHYLSALAPKSGLLGSNTKEAAVVDQWIHFAEHEIGSYLYNIIGLIHGWSGPFSRETYDKHNERLARSLEFVESHLAARPSGFVALDSLTLADLVLAGVIHGGARITFGAAERAQYPHIFAHFARVTADERIKQWFSTEDFVDVAISEPKTA
ncbi:hypothetical protein HYDPIDRAFT_33340 [Hydnomerulius pinastri MD-312]|uniref:Glutathione transferase n=1 Tax=Hydnomerulius pinastri MD-312 TaxID=994086 RepID=A0A0C9VNQ2_9AGAM|nr:hypothetical protein HYDPIDRAFT_33340 [Hydnomerulius pinastri MD-312]